MITVQTNVAIEKRKEIQNLHREVVYKKGSKCSYSQTALKKKQEKKIMRNKTKEALEGIDFHFLNKSGCILGKENWESYVCNCVSVFLLIKNVFLRWPIFTSIHCALTAKWRMKITSEVCSRNKHTELQQLMDIQLEGPGQNHFQV